jgi:hypothetical protein
MSKLDDILSGIYNGLATEDTGVDKDTFMEEDGIKQSAKDLMLELIGEVQKEAFKVGGSINANDLMQRGFSQFDRELRQKVTEL